MLRLVFLLAVVLVLASDVSAGRTIKKHSALIRKPANATTEDGEQHQIPSAKQKAKTSLPVKESDPAIEEESCSGDDNNCKRKPSEEETTTAIVATVSPAYSPYYSQRLPPTMYQHYWRNRLQQSQAQANLRSQRMLAQIQRDALDMARGFLSGFGWELQGWELLLLESIVKMVSKDMLFMFQWFL